MSEKVWMPHAGHLIVGNDCRFHLNTYVNGYIVSTVGEYVPDKPVRDILRRRRGTETNLIGDAEKAEFGFEEIGLNRLYETMVFKAKPSGDRCCPWMAADWGGVDSDGYNEAGDAYEGHLAMVEKWDR